MGMWDVLTLSNDKKPWTKMLTGAYSVSFGDNLSAFIGSGRQTHIVGDEIKYVLDWEGCLSKLPLLGTLLHSVPAQLLFGDGGNMTWTYGRKTDLHYIGPAIAIARAGKMEATSQQNFFGAPSPVANPLNGEALDKSKIDTTTGVVVALLSAAMLAVNTGVEIAARIKYQDNYKKNDKDATEQMTTYCTSTLMVTTRMMYIIKSVELCAAVARNEVSEYYKSKGQVELSTLALLCAGNSEPLRKDIKKRLTEAAKAVAGFIKANILVILALAYLLTLVGVVIGLAVAAAS